jgi:hypothetical protein
MKIREMLLGFAGVAALALTGACSDTRRAQNTPSETPMTSADRVDDDNWMRDRDEYVNRREKELDEYDRRWNEHKNNASAKSRRAWDDVKDESSGLRRELRELKNSTKENWQEAKAKLDSGWDKFETKMKDVFDTDDHR